jgi:HD-GYP domain-containing protein (c-di-GMP phosphodiesterase class II)
MIVYQHHERVDGNGYPVGVPACDIHPWAKLVSIVDVFDAMTGKRPYRKSITAAEALQFIERNAGTHFDPEMAKCWISAMRKA